MNEVFALLVSDPVRAWSRDELAIETGRTVGEIQWDLDQLYEANSIRWVIWRNEILWFAQSQESSIEDVIAAWKHISEKTRLPFVSIEELGNEVGLTVERLHNVFRELERENKVVFSGTNVAVLTPQSRAWAYRWQGNLCFLVRIQ